jgi:hypothetical protein
MFQTRTGAAEAGIDHANTNATATGHAPHLRVPSLMIAVPR